MAEIWKRLVKILAEELNTESEIITPELDLLKKHQPVIKRRDQNDFWSSFLSSWNSMGRASSNLWGNDRYGEFSIDIFERAELIMAVEEEFDLEISDEELENLTTVQSLLNLILFHTEQHG